jgi:hypothetical protein
MKSIKITALLVIAFLLTPTAAIAADIPLLTWERGRQQQVIIAEGDLNRKWVTQLVGNGQEVTFNASAKDAQGYVAHTINLADDFPTGSYEIITYEDGGEGRVIAGVLVVEAATRTAASNLMDLAAILTIFIFLTAIASTIRARKYREIQFKSAQVLPRITDPIIDGEENFWDRLETAPYRLRVNWLNSFKPSLLRFLLIREGELAHRLNKNFYGVAPLLGLIAGVIASIQVNKNQGIAASATTLFLAFAFIGIFDAFSGFAATLGFWAIQIATGNITSLRDILIAIAVGISWVGPSIFAAILRESIGRDFASKSDSKRDPIYLLGTFGAAIIGGLVFYFGQLLLQSIVYIERPLLEVTYVDGLIVAGAIFARSIFESLLVERQQLIEVRDESFSMARVTSPMTSLSVLLISFAFIYNWTQVFSNSLIVSLIFSIPYLFSFVRFNAYEKLNVSKIQRNILLEAVVLAIITFILFKQISLTPVSLEKRVETLLLLAGIAPALHAFLSAIYASSEDKFSFERKTEII